MSYAWVQYKLRQMATALAAQKIAEGKTPEQAAAETQTWVRAAMGSPLPSDPPIDQGTAQGVLTDALKTGASMPYREYERPRLLEEELPIAPDQAFWVAIIYMMVKQPKMLEKLATTFMDTQARIIGNLAQAGGANIITAYSHSFLIALMLEQNYMIRQRGADDLIASLNVLTAARALTDLLTGFAVPEVLTFAATGTVAPGRTLPSPRATK